MLSFITPVSRLQRRPETGRSFGGSGGRLRRAASRGLKLGCLWVWGFGVQGLGFGVWGSGFGVWGLGFRVWGSLVFRVWGLGFGAVWGLGFRVWGLGFRGYLGLSV